MNREELLRPNRAELLRLHALHKAAAAALEAKLKNQALDEYEVNHTAVTWRLEPGQVIASTANTRAVVEYEDDFMDYLEEHTAAVQRIEVRKVPDAFMEPFLATLRPVVEPEEGKALRSPGKKELVRGASFPVVDTEARIVPGVRYVVGGSLTSISIRLDDSTKVDARKAAARYADGEISAEEFFDSL